MAGALAIEGLTKDFGTHRALDGLSLALPEGEIFGFLGPNGAGKSTTIRLLLNFIRPTSGSARILGFDCQEQTEAVHARTGYLPGELHLFNNLSGREHAKLIARLRGMNDTRDIDELADRLGLELDRHVTVYSKGNRQKLGILLALLGKPKVLLLDEPTSGLDPIVQHTVWELLRESAARGTTVFFSSHVLGEVEEVCARVGILRTGELVAVESIAAWRARQRRHVTAEFRSEAPPAERFALPGITELRREESTIEFEVQGEMDSLIKALAKFHVLDFRTAQPTLEELLLSYYRGPTQ